MDYWSTNDDLADVIAWQEPPDIYSNSSDFSPDDSFEAASSTYYENPEGNVLDPLFMKPHQFRKTAYTCKQRLGGCRLDTLCRLAEL